ncbi:MAG: SURF1 family protein [Shimia sp.]|uniref:SURF1 family protein n=1 Tax=Shimia sp. TaxID=1954381 RepID=UPI003B8BB371
MRRLFLPLFFGILGTVVLVSLGTWQLQRLTWKEGVIAEINLRIASAPVALPDSIDVEQDKYLPVAVSGTITEDEIHLLASTRDAGAVYRLVSAFETDGGRRIMIDRGWIKTEDKESPRPAHVVEVTGNLHWPDERDSYTPANDVDGNIWFARDVKQMAEVLGTEPVLVIVREDSDQGAIATPLPVDTAALPNNHLEYVLTWYGLAIVWVAMTLYYLRRMRKTKKA